jgi:hypothetical protein
MYDAPQALSICADGWSPSFGDRYGLGSRGTIRPPVVWRSPRPRKLSRLVEGDDILASFRPLAACEDEVGDVATYITFK